MGADSIYLGKTPISVNAPPTPTAATPHQLAAARLEDTEQVPDIATQLAAVQRGHSFDRIQINLSAAHSAPIVRPKLFVRPAHDDSEQHAGQTARQAMQQLHALPTAPAGPAGAVQRQVLEENQDGQLQRAPMPQLQPSVGRFATPPQ